MQSTTENQQGSNLTKTSTQTPHENRLINKFKAPVYKFSKGKIIHKSFEDRLPNQQKIKESIERVKVECQYDPLNNFNYFAKSGDLAHKFKRALSLKKNQAPFSEQLMNNYIKETKGNKQEDFESDVSQNSKDNEPPKDGKSTADRYNIKFRYSPGKHSRVDSEDIREIYSLVENRINKQFKDSNDEEIIKIDFNQFKHFLKRALPEVIDKLIKGEVTYQQLKAHVLRENDCFIEVIDDLKDKYGKEFFTQDQSFK